ncbi:MAG: hypothetical protein JWR85_81 [Marmoricola sp.]|nr:hypothetical protein [Marmoricola sp.]
MTEDNRERIGLSTAQVAGSALAAVSAAFLASFAGTTGTVIGAAIGSVVATVGAATYTWSLRRTSEVVRRTAAQVRQTTLINGPLPRTVVQGPLRSEDEREGPEEPPSAVMEEAARRRLPWVKVLVASLAVTLAVLGGITVVEAITGKPIASWLGGSSQTSGTTVGDLVRSDKSSPNKDKGTGKDKGGDKPAPSETASPNTPTDPETPEPSQPPVDPEPSQPAVPEPSTAP